MTSFGSWFQDGQFLGRFINGLRCFDELLFCDNGWVIGVDPVVVLKVLGGLDQVGDTLGDLHGDVAQLSFLLTRRPHRQEVHHHLQKFSVLDRHIVASPQSSRLAITIFRRVSSSLQREMKNITLHIQINLDFYWSEKTKN